MLQIVKFAEPPRVVEACARQILDWLSRAIRSNATGQASLAISGGSSPRPMFELFAAETFPWDRVHLFWVDERCVPADDAQSNYKFTKDAWLDHGRVPAANIHRVRTELPPPEAAAAYAQEIRDFFHLIPGQLPVFDAIHRGMGAEGHTASLFPGRSSHRKSSGHCRVGLGRESHAVARDGVTRGAGVRAPYGDVGDGRR